MATQVEVAEHLDLSERQVRNLVKSGVLPSSKGNGGYDPDACRVAYINYLRGLASGQIKPERVVTYEQERARHMKERADALALENERLRGTLAPIVQLEWVLGKVGAQINATLETIPMRIKRVSPKLNAAAIEAIRKEVGKAQQIASSSSMDWAKESDEEQDSGSSGARATKPAKA